MKHVSHFMSLELQATSKQVQQEQLKELIKSLLEGSPKKLWEDKKMQFDYLEGVILLDSDEAEELIPSHITTQDQLNEWKQADISEAEM